MTVTIDDNLAAAATTYISKFGWGTQGRMLGISKMFQEFDLNLLSKGKVVTCLRPRGVLSGFLAIVPSLGCAVYIPPIAGRTSHRLVRMRLSDSILQDGAVLSCYWDQQNLILEDVLVWRGQQVWQTQTFQERWNTGMQNFCKEWQPDSTLQGCQIRLSEYTTLDQLQKPVDREVVEFIPNTANTKRLIWIPTEDEDVVTETQRYFAHRESAIGPDIFTLWKKTDGSKEKMGMALVRTLAISRILRLHPTDDFEVQTSWDKMFERHAIVGICSA